MNPEILNRLRAFLKDDIRQQTDFRQTEQARGLPPPPLQTPCPPDARRIPLPPVGQWSSVAAVALEKTIGDRESRRSFGAQPVSLDTLSFLLWSTQGIRRQLDAGTALRTVPFGAPVNHPGCWMFWPETRCQTSLSALPSGLRRRNTAFFNLRIREFLALPRSDAELSHITAYPPPQRGVF